MSNNAGFTANQPSLFARTRTFRYCFAFLAVSFVNAFVLIFILPKFVQIFHEMGKPLPAITAFVIGFRFTLIQLSIALPILGVMISLIASRSIAFVAICALMLVTIAEVAITVFAIFLPLVSTVQTMSAS